MVRLPSRFLISTVFLNLLVILLIQNVVSAQSPKSYHEFVSRVQHREQFLRKRYTYRHSKIDQDLAFIDQHSVSLYQECTRILEVGRQLPDSVIVPYRLTHLVDAGDEPGAEEGKLVAFWSASDGKQTRRFSRFLANGPCGRTPEHLGIVRAGPWPEFNPDPFFYALNYRGSALMGLSGQAPSDPPQSWYTKHTIEEYDHPKFGRTYIAGGKFEKVKNAYYELLLPEPDFLSLAWGTSKNVDEFNWSTDSVMEYKGFLFPKSGTDMITDADGEITPGTTRWELISIEDFDLMPGEGVDRFPEWPTGTTILDYTTGATIRIPFEAREMAQYNRVISKYCDPSIGPVGLASFGWAFWINTALVLGVVGYGAYHWKKRKAFR
jgi:hypothetical protein